MATSGKSSSVAALLLLVAVLAGSCATGANANCDVVNKCDRDVTLLDVKVALNIDALANVVVPHGQVVTLVAPLVHDLKIVVGGHTYNLLVADILALVNVNAVAKIEIVCNGACRPNALTINVYANVNVLGLLSLQLVGHVCASLVV